MDMIFVSLEDWDDVWRRNQFVCAGLTKLWPDLRILFVGLPQDYSHGLRHGKRPTARAAAISEVPGMPAIKLFKPAKYLPNSIGVGRRFNEALFRKQVASAAKELGFRNPLLWLNPHTAEHMVGRMGERASLYDITDDWASLTQTDRLRRRTIIQDERLCHHADATIVCSPNLEELKRGITRRIYLVQNGVDAEKYEQAIDDTNPLHDRTRAWEKPVYGYTGSLHSDRVDIDLVEQVGSRLEAGSLVFLGPNMLDGRDRARLEANPRICLEGPASYHDLPGLMRAFDVCITPHRVTPFTESLNPIKLFEYLAVGKPIVSTSVAGFRDYPELVCIADSPAAFLSALLGAAHEPPHLRGARRAEARLHTWDARVAAIARVIESIA